VQGVGFRYFVAEAARSADVHGWVRNCPDGSVEAWVQGNREAVDRIERSIRKGSALSRVDSVDVSTEPTAGDTTGFRIQT